MLARTLDLNRPVHLLVAVWTLMRFADEPTERTPSRQITRLERQDPRGSSSVEDRGFDQAVERLTDGRHDGDAAD
jgi:hypothetical protein